MFRRGRGQHSGSRAGLGASREARNVGRTAGATSAHSIRCLPQKASADLVLPLNIATIALVIVGLVLMSVIVLSATALASVVILGTLDWTWVLPVAGLWLLILCGFAATMYRGGVTRHGKGKETVTVEHVHVNSGGQGRGGCHPGGRDSIERRGTAPRKAT